MVSLLERVRRLEGNFLERHQQEHARLVRQVEHLQALPREATSKNHTRSGCAICTEPRLLLPTDPAYQELRHARRVTPKTKRR